MRQCDGLTFEEEIDLSEALPDPTDREYAEMRARLNLGEAEMREREARDPRVREFAQTERRYFEVAHKVIEAQGGFGAAPAGRRPLHRCLEGLRLDDGRTLARLAVVPDPETGTRCAHAQLVEQALEGACRALHEGVQLAVPPATCSGCMRAREKLNAIKRCIERLRQQYEDSRAQVDVDVQLSQFVAVLKQSKKLTRCPFCQTPVIHTNACDHMQCVQARCRKHFCRGCSLNKWLLELGAQVEDRYHGRESFLRRPTNYGGDDASAV